MIRIAITDDKPGNRAVLRDKLGRNPFFELVFEAVDGADFLEQMRAMLPEKRPHIVLMDLEMPHVDGTEAIATASALYPEVKFVVLTIFDDDDKIFKAIRAGACGYLLKEESGSVVTDMLMNLWESGAGPISPSIAYKILQMVQQPPGMVKAGDEPSVFQLSDREQEILRLLSEGLEYKEIGNRIFISPNTVKKHCISIYQKLHVNSKAQALRIAYTKGLI
jgi:DNA-binding NarL/FixJ family response regulator